ncbi:MAG: DUF1232 domain-containing protein [Eubacteriaceae bacterium]|nr:DUF1232 domain-containing protein [Eubacteriaceae bacterium]
MFKNLSNIKYILKMLQDKQVPLSKKAIVAAGILYFLMPFDFLPETVLGFGLIDDLVIMIGIMTSLSDIFNKYRPGSTIKDESKIIKEASYTIKDDTKR